MNNHKFDVIPCSTPTVDHPICFQSSTIQFGEIHVYCSFKSLFLVVAHPPQGLMYGHSQFLFVPQGCIVVVNKPFPDPELMLTGCFCFFQVLR